MSHGISPLGAPGSNPYLRDAPSARSSQDSATPRMPSHADAAVPSPRHQGLNAEEQSMIDRYFPSDGTASMRLYGPSGGTQDVKPASVGSRLDLSA